MRKTWIVLFITIIISGGCISQKEYLRLKKQNEIQARIIHQSEQRIKELERRMDEMKREKQ